LDESHGGLLLGVGIVAVKYAEVGDVCTMGEDGVVRVVDKTYGAVGET
jgi:hypothetical protein